MLLVTGSYHTFEGAEKNPSYTVAVNDPLAPELGEVQMHAVKPKAPVVGRVVSTESCMQGKSASFVRHVSIDVSGTPLAGSFRVGQAFGVIAPGEDDRGKPHAVRLYSLACPTQGEDGSGNVISTTVKRVIDEYSAEKETDDQEAHHLFLGVCSNYLCDINVGDEVLVTGPAGKRFLLPEDPSKHDYLFIATGTGIAPYRGMIMELLEGSDGPVDCEIHLVMGTPYTTDLLYDDYFASMAEEHEGFHYHRVISRSDVRREYVDRYIDGEMDSTFRSFFSNPRTLMYLCGLEGMESGMYRMLARHGLAEGFVNVKEPLTLEEHETWDAKSMKRNVKSGSRSLVEVY
ncbi:MAG: hypothetical protein VX908_01895 [Planctomycetota bacterium]|nr:hypothetical protein [Planctomycetota bacterium]